jgi:hypothetical protein
MNEQILLVDLSTVACQVGISRHICIFRGNRIKMWHNSATSAICGTELLQSGPQVSIFLAEKNRPIVHRSTPHLAVNFCHLEGCRCFGGH